MRIALVAPLVSTIAQPYTGGAQAMLADLAYGLQKRGHQVTLFARSGSYLEDITIEHIAVPEQVHPANFARSTKESSTDPAFFIQANLFLALFLQLRARCHEFDLIHVHAFDWPAYTFSTLIGDIPVLHTLHLPALSPEIDRALQTLDQQGHPLTLIAVSQSCAQTYATSTPIDYIIYNGLDVQAIPFRECVSPDAPLLFVGRISPEKGVEAAIEIAEQARSPLAIIGSIYDQDYYLRRIAPRIARPGSLISYLGQMTREQVWEIMGQAAGLLCPMAWDEAFGLTAVEALATGTPVIAFRRGAMEETLLQDVTGFLVEPGNCTQAALCVPRLSGISRARCRAHVEATFPLEKMLTAYEQVYQAAVTAIKEQPPA